MSPIVIPAATPSAGSTAASGPPTIPHISFPWRMVVQPDGTLAAASDEQDSLDEVVSAVQQIAACPVGAWADQPSFGVPLTPCNERQAPSRTHSGIDRRASGCYADGKIEVIDVVSSRYPLSVR